MRYAILDDQRIEATPGARGTCPGCQAEVLARCGTKKVWHWAHKGRRHCDHWWENETQWHRDWKDKFPTEWQEVPARDEMGELHIADLKTNYGIVVEFQHSAIKPEEVKKRTDFYGQVIWIVDGTRRPTDLLQYERLLSENRGKRFDGVDIYTVDRYETRLLKDWGSLGRFIGFDFGGDNLFLLTQAQGHLRYLFDLPKTEFVECIRKGAPLPQVQLAHPRGSGRRSGRRY